MRNPTNRPEPERSEEGLALFGTGATQPERCATGHAGADIPAHALSGHRAADPSGLAPQSFGYAVVAVVPRSPQDRGPRQAEQR